MWFFVDLRSPVRHPVDMDENLSCPKCRTDLRHSLAVHGQLARCPYCARVFSQPKGTPLTQTSSTPANTSAPPAQKPADPTTQDPNSPGELPTQAPSTSAITKARRAQRPADPITREPIRGQHPYPEDDDYLAVRKRILCKKERGRLRDVGVLTGIGAGLAIGIFVGGICTATADPRDGLSQGLAMIGSFILAMVLMFVGAIVGGVIGYHLPDEPPNKRESRNTPPV